jgi:hypothetical protein
MKTDMAGNYVGSSIVGQPRDWSKFGFVLRMEQGNNTDESWVKCRDSLLLQRVVMGAQFWFKCRREIPDMPRDMFYCSSFQGQMVAIIPSLDLVIVRMD